MSLAHVVFLCHFDKQFESAKMKYIIITLLMFPSLSIAQHHAYYRYGDVIKSDYCSTDRCILDALGAKDFKIYRHRLGYVYFKMLSNEPIFFRFTGIDSPSKIKEMAESYDYKIYLKSNDFYWDMDQMFQSGRLTKDYLLEVFNKPDVIDSISDYWIYFKYNVKINFRHSPFTPAIEQMDYNSIQKSQLQVTQFFWWGEDVEIKINLVNWSRKTIKYVYITFSIFNPVDDKIGTKTVRGIGPINSGEESEYKFERIMYSRTATRLKIENVKLQYMDGSIKTINHSEFEKITRVNWYMNVLEAAGYAETGLPDELLFERKKTQDAILDIDYRK